jgi:hypothetical protein
MDFITISHVVTTITIYAVTHLHSLQSVHSISRSFHVFSLILHLHIFTLRNLPANSFASEVKVTFRMTVSQSVSVGVEPHVGLMTTYLLLFDSYGLVFCGAPSLTRGRVSFVHAAGPCQRSLSRVRVPCYGPHGKWSLHC